MMETEGLRRQQESFTPGRAWSIGFHVVLSSLALLGLVVMLNYLAHRHDHRIYLSQVSAQKLSAHTLQVLAQLTNNVKVTVFFDRREPLFGTVSSLLKEYDARSPRIELEFVDYRMPGRAEAVRAQYKLAAEGETSRVIFDSAGQVRTVLSTELSEYAMTPDQEVKRTGFKGEQLFTSALLNVTQNKAVLACFLQGHGEHRLSTDDQGYERFAKMLENNNIQVRALGPLIGTNDLPEECGLLIAGGPTRRFEQEELDRIEKYLAQGGRMLALFDMQARTTPTGLEQLLYRWNIQVGFDYVQDPGQAQAGNAMVFLTRNYGSHPIVRSLLNSTIKLIAPRSVSQRPMPQNMPDAPKVTEILFTSSGGQLLLPGDGPNTAIIQKEGAIPLAVAGERGAIQGVNTEKGASRIVVVGEALFLSNLLITDAANADFASQIVNWLVNRDALLDEIAPSPISEYQILLTESQMRQVRWLFLFVFPGAVVLFGFFVWMRRRV